MIEFKNVSKTYDNGTKALTDVNIKIEAGEFVFIVGASGAGKSTFLKLIMREEVPSSGTVRILDYDLNEIKKKKIPYFRRHLGIVFQDFRLIPKMTVYDNVAFAMRVIGARSKQIEKRVPYVLNLVGLDDKINCYPNELSGGEQQRVALARALANNADIIVADEPTGNVDPQMSIEIVELLTRLNQMGTTVLMVTHAHDLVRKFDRRVITLEHGCVVSDGNVVESAAAPVPATPVISEEEKTLAAVDDLIAQTPEYKTPEFADKFNKLEEEKEKAKDAKQQEMSEQLTVELEAKDAVKKQKKVKKGGKD